MSRSRSPGCQDMRADCSAAAASAPRSARSSLLRRRQREPQPDEVIAGVQAERRMTVGRRAGRLGRRRVARPRVTKASGPARARPRARRSRGLPDRTQSRIRSASTYVVISAAPAGGEDRPDQVDGGGPVDRRRHAAAGPRDGSRTGQYQPGRTRPASPVPSCAVSSQAPMRRRGGLSAGHASHLALFGCTERCCVI